MTNGADGAPSPVERSDLTARDPRTVGAHLARTYGVPVTISCLGPPGSAPRKSRLRRLAFGAFGIEDVTQDGDIEVRAGGLPCTVILWAQDGRVECDDGGRTVGAESGDLLLLAGRTTPVSVRLFGASLVAVTIASSVFAGVAGDAVTVRFTGVTPVNPVMAQVWKQTVVYVRDTVLCEPEATTPMMLGAAARLLVGATLATFSNTAGDRAGAERGAMPALLRNAMDFVDQNAGRNIGVADIARAVFVTPRRVQHVFREHLHTTPTGYLRDVRLRRAFDDLLATDRTTTTVTATAARWRFTHMGRFAVLYRQTFGESPHETLRRDGPAGR